MGRLILVFIFSLFVFQELQAKVTLLGAGENGVGLLILGEEAFCTAFAIDDDKVMTAFHCVESKDFSRVNFQSRTGVVKVLGLVESRVKADLAVLRIEPHGDESLEIGENITNGVSLRRINDLGAIGHRFLTAKLMSGTPILQDGLVVAVHLGSFRGSVDEKLAISTHANDEDDPLHGIFYDPEVKKGQIPFSKTVHVNPDTGAVSALDPRLDVAQEYAAFIASLGESIERASTAVLPPSSEDTYTAEFVVYPHKPAVVWAEGMKIRAIKEISGTWQALPAWKMVDLNGDHNPPPLAVAWNPDHPFMSLLCDHKDRSGRRIFAPEVFYGSTDENKKVTFFANCKGATGNGYLKLVIVFEKI